MFTFIDETSRHVLIASIDREARDAGHFAFQIAGTRVVSGFGTLTVAADGSLSLAYDGPATLSPTFSLTAPTASPAFSPRPVTISLRATLAPGTHVADATLTVGSDRYVLASRLPEATDVPALLDRIEAALLADDPIALHPLMSTDITGTYTAEQFAAQWRSQAAPTERRIMGLDRGEVGLLQMSDSGYAIIRVAYRALVRETPGTSAVGYEVVLIHQAAGWRLWYTAEQ